MSAYMTKSRRFRAVPLHIFFLSRPLGGVSNWPYGVNISVCAKKNENHCHHRTFKSCSQTIPKMIWRSGLRPEPRWGAYSASRRTRPLAGFGGGKMGKGQVGSKGQEEERERRVKKEGKGRRRMEKNGRDGKGKGRGGRGYLLISFVPNL